jgi:hypothetical protein
MSVESIIQDFSSFFASDSRTPTVILLDSGIADEVVLCECPICGGPCWDSSVMWWSVLWGVGLATVWLAQEKSFAMTIFGRLPRFSTRFEGC